jgi:hypothetical protein
LKKLFASLVLSVSVLAMVGCPGSNPSTPANPAQLAPGYQNSADQQMGEILSGAHAFYTSIQQQSQAGTLTLSPAEKTAFNQFGVSLNAAQTVYLAYHNGQATQQAAQTAVNQVQSQQAALPIPGGK